MFVPTVLKRDNLTSLQEEALRALCIPVLSEIVTLQMQGYLPALAGLSNPGSGIFTETVILLEGNPLAKQISEYLLEMGLVERTRQKYDHHVALTPFGGKFLLTVLSGQHLSLYDEARARRSVLPAEPGDRRC